MRPNIQARSAFTHLRSKELRRGFTLIELLVVLGILGILAGIVITAVAPNRQLAAANDAWRRSSQREIANAITQYVIDTGALPAGIPTGSSNALPICRESMAGETGCVNLDVLVTDDYITALPVDTVESSGALIGFTIYQQPGGFVSVNPVYLGQSGTSGGTTGGATSGGASGGGGAGEDCIESATYPIALSSNPSHSIVVNTTLYVLLQNTGRVVAIDMETETVVATIIVGSMPNGIARVGTKLYVTNYFGSSISVVDTDSNSVVATIAVGEFPRPPVTVGTDVYVPNEGNISVIDSASDTITDTIIVGAFPDNSPPILIGTKLYINNYGSNLVYVIDTGTNAVLTSVTVGSGPVYMTALGTTKLYVLNASGNSVSVIDVLTDTVTETIAIGSFPINAVVVGSTLYVANSGSANVSAINTSTDVVSSTIATITPLTLKASGTKLYVIGEDGDIEVINTSTDTVLTSVSARGVTGSVYGNKLYVSNSSSQLIQVIDIDADDLCS